jgi:hypothetical protein
MQALAASCEELRARTGNPPLAVKKELNTRANVATIPLKTAFLKGTERRFSLSRAMCM